MIASFIARFSRPRPRPASLLAALSAAGALFCAGQTARASIAYGSINNFDTVNDTGVPAHGFEIEIEGIRCADITYTYDWNHYGAPSITEDLSVPAVPRVVIRYASAKLNGAWAAYTAVPAGPIPPTQGHQFTDPTVNFGGEHFGVGYWGTPGVVRYHWLIDDGFGNLVAGPPVNLATPAFSYAPPGAAAPAQVQAVIVPPPPPALPSKEFGEAAWVKEIRTITHNSGEIKLRDLVSADPEDSGRKDWRNGEPDEVETEWQLLQTDFNKADGGRNGKLEGAPEPLDQGDEVVTRRYEFYKYTGPFDEETGEALAENVGADGLHGTRDYTNTIIVGDFIGSQMAAFGADTPLGLIDHLPDGEAGLDYPTRTLVIAGGPFDAAGSGDLPDGLMFDPATGQVSGAPAAGGVFAFHVRVSAPGSEPVEKTYHFMIAASGEELAPHSVVDTSASPLDSGDTAGGGVYTLGDVVTVDAAPGPGRAFESWTDNGRVASRSPAYSFTNTLNRALVAHFVPAPALALEWQPPGTLQLWWPTNFPGFALQENPGLNPSNWAASARPTTVQGTNRHATVAPTNRAAFFRLARP